ncbi:hypothetical protein E4U41_003047 [Claviceps citrina]|nr:hypothetical protein E4U41_003047 [Claviceps citrina]
METIGPSDSSGTEFHARHKGPTPRRTPPSRSRFTVAIRPRPRYVPGTGPALQPLRLMPLAASTGYIIERILLPSPGLAADGRPLPKRMTYIVGWHDLPAASLRVPAMDIFQYISPRALEEWEERLEGEMDEHRQHVDSDAQRPGTNADAAPQRVRRRPPAHTAIEQPAAVESEPDSGPSHAKGLGMSLSTPKKRKLAEFEGLSDEENSPTKQLARELLGSKNGGIMADVADGVVVDRGGGSNGSSSNLITAVECGLKTGEHMEMTKCKHLSINSPVPLPPYVACKPDESGPGPFKPTIVSLGMDSSSEPRPVEDKVMCSIEGGGGTLSDGRRPVASASDQRKRTSTSQTSATSTQTRQRRQQQRQQQQQQRRSSSIRAGGKRQRRSSSTHEVEVVQTETQADDAAWEVERLEDMAVYDVEHRGLVRYFLVRWVGDWPPDQNPSWEPEDNLPAKLIRKYTKLDRKRREKLAAQHQRPPPEGTGWTLRQQDSASAREAFQGHVEQGPDSVPDPVPGPVADNNADSEHRSLDKTLLVLGEGPRTNGQSVKETPVPLPPIAHGFWRS